MKNKDFEDMEPIMKGFGLNIGMFHGDFTLSDGKPGNWFKLEEDNKNYVFISYCYTNRLSKDKEKEDRIAFIFPDKHYEGWANWRLFAFGHPVPSSDEKGKKEMSAFVRKFMQVLSRKNSMESVKRALELESSLKTRTVWGRSK